MNHEHSWTLTAIALSILMHASVAMLGNFQPGKVGAVAGSLSVSVTRYTHHAASESLQEVPSASVTQAESTPRSEPDVDRIGAEEAAVVEAYSVYEQAVTSPVAKPRKTSRQVPEEPARPVARPEKKVQPPERIERKSTRATSASDVIEQSATREVQAVAASNEVQETHTAFINQAGSSVESTAKGPGVIADPEVTAMPLYHLIPKPPYPSRSRDLGESGTVIVAILVAADGRVADAYVSESSGYPLLDGSALSTVKTKWRFKPATSRGKPVESWVRVPVNFNIR